MTARAEIVGFKRQQDLAAAVGCTRGRIARWAAMATPPRKMRKGFDESLTRTLQTTKDTLFNRWVEISPENATEIWGIPDPTKFPWHTDLEWHKKPIANRVSYVARILGDRRAEFWLRVAYLMIEVNAAENRADFEDAIIDRGFGKHMSDPPLPLEMTKEAILKRRNVAANAKELKQKKVRQDRKTRR